MPVFMEPASELTALLIMGGIAAPAVLILCCILEECPLKSKDTFEDLPLLCGFTANDCSDRGASSLFGLIVLAAMFLLFSASAGFWYMTWRGAVMASSDGASVSSVVGLALFAKAVAIVRPTTAAARAHTAARPAVLGPLLKRPARGLSAFGAGVSQLGASLARPRSSARARAA
mmetsp:Transcript_56153/g.130757  ORF Transcript_56153/g.130757 Transcript_56153/m.130757 type:complete len:174 (+) Transcript_56153:124-645(+)